MQISTKDWKNYIAKLSKLNNTAAEKMQQYIAKHGFADTEAIIDYAYGLVSKYGEGSAALSAQMFETVAEMEGAVIQPAVMAQTASRNEVAKMVNGIMKQSQNENVIANAVGRKVKQAGADTTLQNALRYGAEFAWIPAGDTCAFCIALASRGWQTASKKAIKNGHAEHIHSNCDCTYAIRFDSKTHIEGYDPRYYERMYYDAQDRAAEEGTFWTGKSDKDAINQMRREKYKLNAEKIREQHREAYAKRKAVESSQIDDIINSKKAVNTKILSDGTVANPMDVVEYDRMKKALEKQGIEVFAATNGDDLRYMQFIGAEGTYSNGRITHIGEIPSRGTFLEEIIHMNQSKLYGELDSSDIKELCAREVEANRKLFKYRKEYRLDNLDIADIERNKEYWEKKFTEVIGVAYDESNYRRKI